MSGPVPQVAGGSFDRYRDSSLGRLGPLHQFAQVKGLGGDLITETVAIRSSGWGTSRLPERASTDRGQGRHPLQVGHASGEGDQHQGLAAPHTEHTVARASRNAAPVPRW